ncbi:hypothetical protein [Mumia sp. DW29H23]|uniref:hypothetical protein n=1 Tax=Mumia sp. DW29H23 TaxID=3421241 RepID=UPI003D69D20B
MARGAPPPEGEQPTLAVGAVVRADLVARLLGVKLLRIVATIVVTPPAGPPVGPPVGPPTRTPVARSVTRPLDPRALPVVPGVVLSRDGGLPEAELLLREARTTLAARRRG